MRFERFDAKYDRTNFDCGHQAINHYLWNMANQHHKKGISKTHLLVDGDEILGFYTLSNMSIDNQTGFIKGYPRQIPAILIGRMGVSVKYQGQGLSKTLLSHAINKVQALSLDTGIAFVMIDAKTDELSQYYQRLGFKSIDGLLLLAIQQS